MHDILTSRLWRGLANFLLYDFQTTMFQPVGGMGRIGEAFARQLPGVIRYGAKVTDIRQDESGVRVHFEDIDRRRRARGGESRLVRVHAAALHPEPACRSTSRRPMKAAIDAVPYAAAVKVGLQFKRRFWEEDERIYGGISYTDLPIRQISYPSGGLNAGGKGVLLGAYLFGGPNAYEFTAMSPAERIERAVEYRRKNPPAIPGKSSRTASPSRGLARRSRSAAPATGRTKRAAPTTTTSARSTAESCSPANTPPMIPAWQEGAILSALDAVGRLHQRVMAQ